jgi:hypothetical protein
VVACCQGHIKIYHLHKTKSNGPQTSKQDPKKMKFFKTFVCRSSIFQTLAIVSAITYTILLVVKLCVLNQSHGYWLLLDALFFAFTLCISMKVDLARIQI